LSASISKNKQTNKQTTMAQFVFLLAVGFFLFVGMPAIYATCIFLGAHLGGFGVIGGIIVAFAIFGTICGIV